MLQRLVVILILCFTCALNAQGEANVWYFGENAGLDFNSGTPVALTNGALVTNEGCASISDSVGNLLFYTDGVTVYNNNHTIMPNGNGLNGDSSSTHSAIIVPKPGNNDEYYIFTVDRGGQSDGLQYSQVNMNLDNGLGDVVSGMKNVFLVAPTTEKVTAIKKNRFRWILGC